MGENRDVHGVEAQILEMKDTSELMVDLAYTALLYDNKAIANAVYELEERIDHLLREVQREALEQVDDDEMAPDHALVLLRLAQATEVISDSAQEIANVVLRDIPMHPVLRESVEDSDVVIRAVDIGPGAELDGTTLGDVQLATETGMTVIAIRHGEDWVYGPDKRTEIRSGDRLFARGPEEGVDKLLTWCGQTAPAE